MVPGMVERDRRALELRRSELLTEASSWHRALDDPARRPPVAFAVARMGRTGVLFGRSVRAWPALVRLALGRRGAPV